MTYLKMAIRNLYRRRSRTVFTIVAIGMTVSMMVLLISVSLGLKESSVSTGSIDFWVVPADSDILDPITGSGQIMLGDVHNGLETLLNDPSVKGASPVMNRIAYARSDNSNQINVVLAVGVVPGAIDVMPASIEGFTKGDPYFSDGEWTAEAVINRQMADLLGITIGDALYINISSNGLATSTPFKVMNIVDTVEYSNYPGVVLHLSELQKITGHLEHDRADQIVVDGPGAGPLLRLMYPQHLVLTGTEYVGHRIISDKRILPTAAASSLISFVLGILFIGTTMVMSISEREGDIAVMKAIGISRLSILLEVFCESLLISTAGGLAGVIFTLAGKVLLNFALLRFTGIDVSPVTELPLLVGGFAVAVGAGIFTGLLAAVLMKQPDISRVF
ncbi:MAG: hypothetical protein M8353_08905 [ANME-2 cluster archaeon]|nr:hypothetical protein [ANME-2 cluster archaeon]